MNVYENVYALLMAASPRDGINVLPRAFHAMASFYNIVIAPEQVAIRTLSLLYRRPAIQA